MTKTHVDPEYERWYRKYPRFPGVVKCIELLRSSNVHGAWIDVICYELENHAAEHADELIVATRAELECESGVGRILLHVVADSKLPQAFDLFAELLESPDETLRPYGVAGLRQLNTKAARRLLWQHGAS